MELTNEQRLGRIEERISTLEYATEYVTKLADMHGVQETKYPGLNLFAPGGVNTVLEQIIGNSTSVADWILER